MTNFFDFETPMGRKDYFFSSIKRLIVLFFILIVYSLLDLTLINPNKSFDIEYIDFITESYPFGVLEVFLFLSIDIRRLKNIGISLNWLYPYYLLYTVFPNSINKSNMGYTLIDTVLTISILSFTVFLFIKKGSSKLSTSAS
tara:strand:+ start:490 stop:915 length:426 start_codon:yes stop_codon:yes gene_type:complete